MAPETRQCQNCKKKFTIEPEDFDFYKKIDVLPPTFCPECRLQRRMSWRNERSLYKRKCNAPGHSEEIITMYDPEKPYVIFDTQYWWSDEWDPLAYGSDYDFSKSFFQQFSELLHRAPLAALSNLRSVNSEYTNHVDGNKNCYLIFGSGWNENVRYGNKLMSCKDSQDLLICTKCELSYESVGCVESHRLFWSRNSKNCTDSYFLYNCRDCLNCFGCTNLINKSYCFWNKQYSKEDYFVELKKLGIDSAKNIPALEEKFLKEIYLPAIHRYANVFSSVNCTGDNINHSKNCKNCFDIYQEVEDSKYLYSALNLKDSYDGNGVYANELSYEYVDCNVGNKNFSTIIVYDSNNVSYSFNCHNCQNCFGCTGLRGKQYCILNKQYTKEEYENLMPKVIQQMNRQSYIDKKERVYKYGEFFPTEISPFAYNETIAQEYFPLTKEEVMKLGYGWRDQEERHYEVTKNQEDLPDRIEEVDDSILGEVIGCAHGGKCNHQCTTAFKVIKEELEFYRKMNIPLPHLCPNCRHYKRLAQKNPLKLWHRRCQCAGSNSENKVYQNTIKHQHSNAHCPNEFETSYAPERPEIVYCEKCYQSEVV